MRFKENRHFQTFLVKFFSLVRWQIISAQSRLILSNFDYIQKYLQIQGNLKQ